MPYISDDLRDLAETLDEIYNDLEDIELIADDIRHARDTESVELLVDDIESKAHDAIQRLRGRR